MGLLPLPHNAEYNAYVLLLWPHLGRSCLFGVGSVDVGSTDVDLIVWILLARGDDRLSGELTLVRGNAGVAGVVGCRGGVGGGGSETGSRS